MKLKISVVASVAFSAAAYLSSADVLKSSESILLNITNVAQKPIENIIADQWLIQLKDCKNVVEHKANLMKKLIDNPQVKLLHFYHFSTFCGYALKIVDNTGDALNFQNPDNPAINSGQAFLAFVRAQQDVLSVQSDKIIQVAGRASQFDAPWNLQRICQRFYPLNPKKLFVYDDRAGSNVDVYVMDSGILLSHPEFGGRARLGINLSGEPDEPQDVSGHGTHVAGIIGSQTYGVSKRANLISVRVLTSGGIASYSTIIAGIEWIVRNAANSRRPSVINLSSAGPPSTTLNNAFVAAVKAGIHLAISAGNNASDACDYSPANIRYPGATVVGSVDENTDALSSFSNFGSCVTINAPGANVLSTWTNPPDMPPYNRYTAWASGTSEAAPHVAGVKALYLAAGQISPAQLEQTLLRTATTNRIRPIPKGTFNGIVFQRPAQ